MDLTRHTTTHTSAYITRLNSRLTTLVNSSHSTAKPTQHDGSDPEIVSSEQSEHFKFRSLNCRTFTYISRRVTCACFGFISITHHYSYLYTRKRKLRSLGFRLWTFPVLVDGPFGVVSAVEFIGIVLFIIYVVYSMTYYALESVSLVSKFDTPSKTDRYVQ